MEPRTKSKLFYFTYLACPLSPQSDFLNRFTVVVEYPRLPSRSWTYITMKATPLLIASHNDNIPIHSIHFDPHGKGRLATAGKYVLDSSRSTLLVKYDMLIRSVSDNNVRVRTLPLSSPLPLLILL